MDMRAIYTAKAAVEVSGFTVYPDASGACAVVRVADFAYSASYTGVAVRLTCIKHPSNGRRASEVAAQRAEKVFTDMVNENTTPEWRDACVKMYSDA